MNPIRKVINRTHLVRQTYNCLLKMLRSRLSAVIWNDWLLLVAPTLLNITRVIIYMKTRECSCHKGRWMLWHCGNNYLPSTSHCRTDLRIYHKLLLMMYVTTSYLRCKGMGASGGRLCLIFLVTGRVGPQKLLNFFGC